MVGVATMVGGTIVVVIMIARATTIRVALNNAKGAIIAEFFF